MSRTVFIDFVFLSVSFAFSAEPFLVAEFDQKVLPLVEKDWGIGAELVKTGYKIVKGRFTFSRVISLRVNNHEFPHFPITS